jgi:TetR/AcrR family tetracycline transcriptional repressor
MKGTAMTPRKKDTEQLSRERVLAAAMHIIETDGVDGLSMRRLGAELGVNPMAAYHYVPSKAALYDLVLDAVMESVDLSGVSAGAPLEERLKHAARAYRAAILAHPRAIPILAGRSVRTVAGLRPIEPMLGLLFEAGLDATQAIAAVDAVAQYVLGGCVGYYHHMVDAELHDDERAFEALPPEEFPNMTRVLAEAHYAGFDEEFELGLDAMVRGLLSGPRYEMRG